MKGFSLLFVIFLLLTSDVQANGTEAEASSDAPQSQMVSSSSHSDLPGMEMAETITRIKRHKLKFKRCKRKKLTKPDKLRKLGEWHQPNKLSEWNQRANLVIIISWAVTVLGFLAFLLSLMGAPLTFFSFGLFTVMLGVAGMLFGLIWGLTGKEKNPLSLSSHGKEK